MQKQAAPADVFINGRFLTQPFGGVQRFSREIVNALDKLIGAGIDAGNIGARWTLLIPEGAAIEPAPRHIAIRHLPATKGFLWDQLIRFFVTRGSILVGLGNSGPVFRRRSLVVVHDAAVYRTPDNFTWKYRTFHRLLGRLIAVWSSIGTVSRFSREELSKIFHLNPDRIFLMPNGCDQVRNIVPDASVTARFELIRDRYFLFVGSPSPNKNLECALKAFAALGRPEYRFVIVGSTATLVFGKGLTALPEGVIGTGKIPDEQVKTLMMNATALVFPSLYEGFGIPPLEAMMNDCPVLAAAIPPVIEVCGDAVLYFDPKSVESLTAAMRRSLDEPALLRRNVELGRERSAMYTWEHSARALMDAVAAMQ